MVARRRQRSAWSNSSAAKSRVEAGTAGAKAGWSTPAKSPLPAWRIAWKELAKALALPVRRGRRRAPPPPSVTDGMRGCASPQVVIAPPVLGRDEVVEATRPQDQARRRRLATLPGQGAQRCTRWSIQLLLRVDLTTRRGRAWIAWLLTSSPSRPASPCWSPRRPWATPAARRAARRGARRRPASRRSTRPPARGAGRGGRRGGGAPPVRPGDPHPAAQGRRGAGRGGARGRPPPPPAAGAGAVRGVRSGALPAVPARLLICAWAGLLAMDGLFIVVVRHRSRGDDPHRPPRVRSAWPPSRTPGRGEQSAFASARHLAAPAQVQVATCTATGAQAGRSAPIAEGGTTRFRGAAAGARRADRLGGFGLAAPPATPQLPVLIGSARRRRRREIPSNRRTQGGKPSS